MTRLSILVLAATALLLVGCGQQQSVTTSNIAPPATPIASTLAPGLTAKEISFQGSDGLTLHGTILEPGTPMASRPGVVLVHGSGAGTPRTKLLQEATAFAQQGIFVLVYDKRSVGYSLFQRSYAQLADDALGAVGALRAHRGVNPANVGIWGLSEGGWVAPLAATRSTDIAFVIVVGANALEPLRQQTWAVASALRRAGVAGSLLDQAVPNMFRLLADAELFPEPYHDAEAVLRQVRQPLLGIWGSHDLLTPPEENPALFVRALEQGRNTHYTLRFFPAADHAVHQSPDGGLTKLPSLAPGYAELVGTWVGDAAGLGERGDGAIGVVGSSLGATWGVCIVHSGLRGLPAGGAAALLPWSLSSGCWRQRSTAAGCYGSCGGTGLVCVCAICADKHHASCRAGASSCWQATGVAALASLGFNGCWRVGCHRRGLAQGW
jgi:uncharacterized protein